MKKFTLLALLSTLILASCSQSEPEKKEEVPEESIPAQNVDNDLQALQEKALKLKARSLELKAKMRKQWEKN